MKKLFYSVLAIISICLYGLRAFAESTNGGFTVGRVEAVDYIITIGCGIFLIGMLFIILALRDSKNKLGKDKLYDYFEYDEEYDKDDKCDDVADRSADFDDDEVYYDSDIDEIEEPEATDESSDVDEIDKDEPQEESVESFKSEEEPVAEPMTALEDEIDDENKTVAEVEDKSETETELELEKPKVRITLTGINNPDVKIMEFTDKITVGRRASNDIMLSDGAISGKHCEISFESEAVYVTDLESTNGTYINDEPVVRAEINSGDMLIIGKSRYRINVTK